jgi:hypothetical protein
MSPFYALLKAKFPDYNDGNDDFDDAWKIKNTQPAIFVMQSKEGKLLDKRIEEEKDGTVADKN